jgi:alpha-glucosidase (family GH31 glycosyl hydrolase)
MKQIIKPQIVLRASPMFLALCLVGLSMGCQANQRAGVYRARFESNDRRLVVEVLDDDLVHFELAKKDADSDTTKPIYASPMVFKTDYRGPTKIRKLGDGVIETAEMRIAVAPATLTVTITDISKSPPVELTSLLPVELGADATTLTIEPKDMRCVYGLGEQFAAVGKMDGDWIEHGQRTPGNEYGNALVPIDGKTGNVGNAQFPVMYALGEMHANYALFFDHLYAQGWGFGAKEWGLATQGPALRWYAMTGPDLPDLRKDYVELVGRPPVPPKKAFGLWVSEYGFDNWKELEDHLATLRASAFPVDGFVLDLQWFGGVKDKSPLSRMGSLDWDETNFPEPAKKIAELREKYGVGIIPIEEPYVSEGLSEFAAMEDGGYLAKKGTGNQAILLSSWWGLGGMVDWTNPAGSDYWHDLQRRPLIEAGVSGHWTDLGEPERYDPAAMYYGFPERGLHTHRDVANIYNFKWAESVARGYDRNGVKRRPFILSRSGTSGIQRFGAVMWSGDIGSRLGQLAAHMNVQMHMSFSGIDYFGADIGGFQRWALDGDLNEMYTQWFADGAAIDVPVRPHTSNVENAHQTAPDRIGDLPSNLANIRQRYELTPYLYSLAHRAYLHGEPVVPPLVLYYQDDPEVRQIGGEKLLGRDLLVAVVAKYGQKTVDVYLPVGGWVNYHTNQYVDSRGQWVRDLPLYVDGRYRLPMFARAGAIIPQMYVDEETMNVLGKRADGERRDELIAQVYAAGTPSSFTLYEDDGETIAYKSGAVRTTVISQEQKGDSVTVKIAAAAGKYAGAPERRDNVVKLVTSGGPAGSVVRAVLVNGSPLPRMMNRESFDVIASAWYDAGGGLVVARSGEMDIGKEKVFVFETK